MAHRCGIDLGTTYSAISFYNDYSKEVETLELATSNHRPLLRSVVYFSEGGADPIVGDTAWNQRSSEPDRVIVGIKQQMGHDYKTQPIDGREYTPEEVSAQILKTLAKDAEPHLDEPVTDVVITVPAHFGDAEREATKRAAELAGLNVMHLLSEPQAAALAYALKNPAKMDDRYILVYDLGGGTFDVSLLHGTGMGEAGESFNLQFTTIANEGNQSLGGLQWDDALMDLVAEKALDDHGVDITENPDYKAFLHEHCERAKMTLTQILKADVIADVDRTQVFVSREEFEERTEPLLAKTEALLKRVLETAEEEKGVPRDKVEVMLCGGSSRMPMVKRMIERVTGKEPFSFGNPDLLVSIGAAYRAQMDGDDAVVERPVPDAEGTPQPTPVQTGLVEVTAYGVGVEVWRQNGEGDWGRYIAEVIGKNAEYEKDFERTFYTQDENSTEISIKLFKHDPDSDKIRDDQQPMKEFIISGLPSGRPKGQPVNVIMRYDASGIVNGKAIDVTTGKEIEISVNSLTGTSE